MKYSINYFKNSKTIDKADEIIVRGCDAEIVDFCRKYPTKTIIADIHEIEQPLSYLKYFEQAGDNLTLKLTYSQLDILLADLKESHIPFIINEPCLTWDELILQLEYEPSQVYIAGELGFDLQRVKNICSKHNTKIRVYPNIAQFSSPKTPKNTFKNFFIYPSAVPVYEDYIDVFEFFGKNLEKQDILFKIYTEKVWDDDISLLIIGLKESIYDNMIPIATIQKRLSCGKMCVKQGTCHACEAATEFAKVMFNHSLNIDKDSRKTELETIKEIWYE